MVLLPNFGRPERLTQINEMTELFGIKANAVATSPSLHLNSDSEHPVGARYSLDAQTTPHPSLGTLFSTD